MNPAIIQAINDKNVLKRYYHGFSCIIEPHACGRDRNGNELRLCYQTSGGSKWGENTGWKLLRVNEIFTLTSTAQAFNPRPDYTRDDNAMEYVIAQL